MWDEKNQEWFCSGCGSKDPDVCLNHALFEPELTKEELHQSFRNDICNTQRMLRDYRDVATLLWTLGQFDLPEEYEKTKESILGIEHRQNVSTLEEENENDLSG